MIKSTTLIILLLITTVINTPGQSNCERLKKDYEAKIESLETQIKISESNAKKKQKELEIQLLIKSKEMREINQQKIISISLFERFGLAVMLGLTITCLALMLIYKRKYDSLR